MNVQTEHQPDHTALLTVEIDDASFEDARKRAARSLSKKVNIPGFRKGKVPLRILSNYVGEGSIIEEAVELLSQDVYRAALVQSGVNPYGPGALVDIKTETMPPTLVYTVPLQPTTDLGDYRSLRLDFEPIEITDDQVNRSMKALQEQHAVVEESQQPAEMGNRITMALHSYFVDDKAEESETEPEADHDHDEEHDHDEGEGHDHEGHDHDDDAIHEHMSDDQEVYLHEHEMQFTLDTENDLVPGFAEAMVGVAPNETREFTLEIPADDEDDEVAGRTLRFIVTAKKVENMTLPALNDEFAARVTKDEEQPLSLLELRIRMRENLQKAVEDRQKADYSRQALDMIVEQAALAYPEAMIVDHVNMLLEDFDQRLRRNGITLQDYLKINQKTQEDLYTDWRGAGENSVKRSLVLQALVLAERLSVDDAAINRELDRFVQQFAEDSRESLREALAADRSMRDNIGSNLIQDLVFERIVAIARGEAPPLPEDIAPPAESSTEVSENVEAVPSEQCDTSENEETAST